MRREPGSRRRRLVALTAALLCSGSMMAKAQEKPSSFGARDPGAISCELLEKMHERAPSGTERQFYDWAQGYFAGRSAGQGKEQAPSLPSDGPGREAAFGQLLGYCGKHPAATFTDAVLNLWAAGTIGN